jgi:two-component system invasion response regulator UvrY
MRLLIVDDHPLIREGLSRALLAEFPGSTCVTAATAPEAVSAAETEAFSIVVLDLSLPGRDGFELLRQIKDRSPSSRVLIHTMHPEEQFGVRALRSGADGYVTKDRPVEELLTAVHRLQSGARYITPTLAERLVEVIARGQGEDLIHTLSDREHQILRLIVAGSTVTEIGDQLNLSVKTISTYRARVLEKLGLRTTAELVRFAMDHHLI